MKGVWLKNLLVQCMRRSLPVKEAVAFGLARIKHKPLPLQLQGILFENVDHVFWSILADVYVNQVYTPPGMNISGNDIVVDIGAHRGAFTSYAAKRSRSTIYAFEPDPGNFKSLSVLVKTNHLNNVIAYNAAIAGKTGTATLFLSPTSTRHTLQDQGDVSGTPKTIDVATLSLDDCLKDLPHVDFLKMDCEGSEIEILLEANKDALAKIRNLAMEIHAPIDSNEIRQVQAHIRPFFSSVTLKTQNKKNLGYLYARQ